MLEVNNLFSTFDDNLYMNWPKDIFYNMLQSIWYHDVNQSIFY